MSDLSFAITGVSAEQYSAAPLLTFRLRVTDKGAEQIDAITLRVQVQLEPQRRHYTATEEQRLVEIFGKPEQWGVTLRTLHWTQVAVTVPGFLGSTEFDVQIPCTYDFEVASTKYFHALEDGDISVLMMFSGTIFRGSQDGFGVELVPWHLEAHHRMPVSVWREAMDAHFPNSAWIRLQKERFDELYQFKIARGLNSWEETVAALLDFAKEAP